MQKDVDEAVVPLMGDGEAERDAETSSIDMKLSRSLRKRSIYLTSKPYLIFLSSSALVLALYWMYKVHAGIESRSGHLRPSLHYSPPTNSWLNDPNGLFKDDNGTWHMYYQHLPSPEAGNCKNWAHVTSKNLYAWTEHHLAIQCDEYGIYSGSIVIDRNNTSGLFPEGKSDAIVAVYTQHNLKTNSEEQSLAYSLDGGYTFTNYKHNPVLTLGKESFDFRDPKVSWHQPSRKWVMSVAYAARQKVAIYVSTNLRIWEYASEFDNPFLSDQHPSFECPNLIPLPVVDMSISNGYSNLTQQTRTTIWILLLSSGSGHPITGGSVTRYFFGSFNGTHFKPTDKRADRLLDFGPDNYASQYFYNVQDSTYPISIGWAANLQTCASTPSGWRELWRGMMSLPRYGILYKGIDGDLRYLSEPVDLDNRRGELLLHEPIAKDDILEVSYSHIASGALVLDIILELKNPITHVFSSPPSIHFSFSASSSPDEVLCSIEFNKGGPIFMCDGSKASGFDRPLALSTMKTAVPKFNGDGVHWVIQAIIDRSILEVYLNRGLRTGTLTFYPESDLDTVVIETRNVEDVLWGDISIQELRAEN